MDSAQRELVVVLLNRICSLGLISNSTCSRAVDLVHAAADLPDFFHPPCLAKEENRYEHPAGTP